MFLNKTKFFSIVKLKELFLRFPVALLVTVIGTSSSILLVYTKFQDYQSYNIIIFNKLLFLSIFAFPWVVLSELLSEKFKLSSFKRYAIQIIVMLSLFLYYFFLPEGALNFGSSTELVRLLFLSGIGFIFLFLLPFDSSNSQRLWRYAATIVRGVVIAFLFAIPLGIGLTLSVASIWYLFELGRSSWQVISCVWYFVFGIFATWVFLSYIPDPHEEPSYEKLSKILQLFVNYIWFPLVGVFFTILYVYCGRILITSIWPEGGVVYWTLGFSIAGLLLYLVSYGKQKKYERFKEIFFKIFFVLLIPLVFVLFWSIILRIQEYGVTESRYLVLLVGVFLTTTSLYYLARKKYMLRFMAWLAAVLMFFAVFGPFNMFRVSLVSQVNRLEQLLVENNILINAKIETPKVNSLVPGKNYSSIQSIISYVIRHDKGLDYLQPWFDQDLKELTKSEHYGRSRNTSKIIELLGISPKYGASPAHNFIFFQESKTAYANSLITVTGYDFIATKINLYNNRRKVISGLESLVLYLDAAEINITKNKQNIIKLDLAPTIKKFIDTYGSDESLSRDEMSKIFENDSIKLKLIMNRVSGEAKDESDFKINNVDFSLLVVFK